jgi:hypothetical protein
MQCGSEAEQCSARDFVEALMSVDTEDGQNCVTALTMQAASLTDGAVLIIGRLLGLGGAEESRQKLKQLNLFTLQQLQSHLGSMGVEHSPGMRVQ